MASYITMPFPKEEELQFPIASVQNSVASLDLRFAEDTESGMTQDVVNMQHFTFPIYDDEDTLDWDVAITTPPPRPSGTIRVKLKYIGRSKPFPIENFWEE